jgi:hypothetical protein
MNRIKNLTHGQWMGIGLALGVFGGIVFGNLGLGIPLGFFFGLFMGRGKPGDT